MWWWRAAARDAVLCSFLFFFQAEDGIRDSSVTGVQTCALPISLTHPRPRSLARSRRALGIAEPCRPRRGSHQGGAAGIGRSEEHTSELQSHLNLVCRLLLEKKKQLPHNAVPRTLCIASEETATP